MNCYKAMEKLEGGEGAGSLRRWGSSVTPQKGRRFASPGSEQRCYDWCRGAGMRVRGKSCRLGGSTQYLKVTILFEVQWEATDIIWWVGGGAHNPFLL